MARPQWTQADVDTMMQMQAEALEERYLALLEGVTAELEIWSEASGGSSAGRPMPGLIHTKSTVSRDGKLVTASTV